MKITIIIDGKETEAAQSVIASAAIPADALDASGSVDVVAGDIPNEDVGGPPTWLIKEVDRAASAEADSQDAGSGPA